MSVTVLWSAYLAMQYAFVGIVQTRKGKDSYGKTSKEDNNLPEKDKQKPILLLEAKSIVAESNHRKMQITPMSHPLFLSLLPARPISKALMTSIRVRQSVRRKEYRPSMSIFSTSCPLSSMRRTWTSSAQTC